MPSVSPVTVDGVNSFVEDLAGCENEINEFYESTAIRLQQCKSDNGMEIVMKGEEANLGEHEFQLQLAHDCFNKGISRWTESDFDLAMDEFSRALELREDLLGRLDDESSKCYLWIGTVHFHREEYEKALDAFTRSFRIKLELTGSREFREGLVSNWINKVLDAKGDDISKDLFWKNLLSCIEHERNGDDLRNAGEFEKAITEYRASLRLEYARRGMTQALCGRPLADMADIFFKIAKIYLKLGNYERALMDFRQALSIYMAKFGRLFRYTVDTYENIADLGELLGYSEAATKVYIDNIYNAICQEKTGDMLFDGKDYNGAIKAYHESLKLEDQGMGKGQVPAATLYYKIGKIQAKHFEQKHDEALVSYCKALGVFADVLGGQHKYTLQAKKMIRSLNKAHHQQKKQQSEKETEATELVPKSE